MSQHYILTVISDDKPGIIETIAQIIAEHNGNWLESKLSQLGGKFAGAIEIRMHDSQFDALFSALKQLATHNIQITLEPSGSSSSAQVATQLSYFHAVGPDRPGIVKEISQTLANANINLVELSTKLSSMPYSGEPLFEAAGSFLTPDDTHVETLEEKLHDVANRLAMDISIENKERSLST